MAHTERGYRVAGLDGSLTSFGIAVTSGPGLVPALYRIEPKTLRGHERLELLVSYVREYVAGADLVVMEGLAYAAKGSALLDLAGLSCLVRHELWKMGLPYAVVAPAQVKQFMTGNGGADKFEVCAAVAKRFRMDITQPDQADALALAAMGAVYLGEPLIELPQAQQAVVWAKWDGKQRGHKRGDPKIVWPLPPGPVPPLTLDAAVPF